MRLWHQKLIPYLPRQQLLGQHRECAALRGKGWGRKHSVVDYVFTYDPAYLVAYHYLVMNEMKKRGYHPDGIWYQIHYRGKELGIQEDWVDENKFIQLCEDNQKNNIIIYPEHNNEYFQECLDNLINKGIEMPITNFQ